MKRILVPCDFSKPAINAFRFALDLAAQSKGSVQLLHVIELPAIADPIIMPVVAFEKDFMNDLKENAMREFSKVITKYNTEGIKVKSTVEFGVPSRMVTDFAEKNPVDVIVMGSHGASGVKEYFVGSNAEKIVRRSPVPVLVMKEYYKGPVKNIVFPNTLETEKQEDLIMKVKELQNFFKATIHILYVNTPTNFTADNLTYDRLNRFAKRFMLKNYTLNIFNYPFEEPGIIQFAKSIKADLIAMGTHGRKGISHLLNGSLAEDLVNHANCPIWTFGLSNKAVTA